MSLRSTRLRDVNGTVWHVPNGTIAAGRQHEPAVGPGAARRRRWPTAPTSTRPSGASRTRPTSSGRTRRGRARCSRSPRCGASRTSAPDGVTIRLVVKTQPAEQFEVLRELRGRIKAALDAAGVEIPTAQRTVLGAPRRPATRRRGRRRGRPRRASPTRSRLSGSATLGSRRRASTVDGEGVADLGGRARR